VVAAVVIRQKQLPIPSHCKATIGKFLIQLKFGTSASNFGTSGAELQFQPLNMRLFCSLCQNVAAIIRAIIEVRHLRRFFLFVIDRRHRDIIHEKPTSQINLAHGTRKSIVFGPRTQEAGVPSGQVTFVRVRASTSMSCHVATLAARCRQSFRNNRLPRCRVTVLSVAAGRMHPHFRPENAGNQVIR
jgi:hypothetical protein